jgi:predicted translin family RNA/ssDNA-binding protein
MSKKMSSKMSKKELTNTTSSAEGWDGAISEAERQIKEAKQKIATLKFRIKTFEHLKESGAPFPNEIPSAQ